MSDRVTDKTPEELEKMWLEACGEWRYHEMDATAWHTAYDEEHDRLVRLRTALTRLGADAQQLGHYTSWGDSYHAMDDLRAFAQRVAKEAAALTAETTEPQ